MKEKIFLTLSIVSLQQIRHSLAQQQKQKLLQFYTNGKQTLAAAATDNAVIEGDEATVDALTATTRLSNSAQIMDKVITISGTQEAVDKAGRASELAYQIAKKQKN